MPFTVRDSKKMRRLFLVACYKENGAIYQKGRKEKRERGKTA